MGCCLQSHGVTKSDLQCVLHQIYQVGSPGLSAVAQPNARTGAPQTTDRLLILGHLENFVTRETQMFELALPKHSVPQLLPTIYPHSSNWVECKSHSSAEPDTKVIAAVLVQWEQISHLFAISATHKKTFITIYIDLAYLCPGHVSVSVCATKSSLEMMAEFASQLFQLLNLPPHSSCCCLSFTCRNVVSAKPLSHVGIICFQKLISYFH